MLNVEQICSLALLMFLTLLSLCSRWSVLCQADAVQGICDHAGSLSAALWEENGWSSLYTSLDGGNLLVSSHFVSTRYVHVPLLITPHYSCECLIRLTSHKIKSSRREKQFNLSEKSSKNPFYA